MAASASLIPISSHQPCPDQHNPPAPSPVIDTPSSSPESTPESTPESSPENVGHQACPDQHNPPAPSAAIDIPNSSIGHHPCPDKHNPAAPATPAPTPDTSDITRDSPDCSDETTLRLSDTAQLLAKLPPYRKFGPPSESLLQSTKSRRKRTITMDSEDAEQVPELEDLVHVEENAGAATLQNLQTMRKAERFCDVTIKVGSRNIPAHRAVLAIASSYLFELFDQEERNGGKQYYQLDDNLNPDCVEVLVDYAYTGKLEVRHNLVNAVYKTATLLKMQDAAEACSSFIAANLSTANCLCMRAFANSHCDGDLTLKTDEYIQQNMASIVGTAEMQQLPTIQVEIIGVTGEELKDHGERHLAKMVVTWLEQAQAERNFQALCEDRQVLYLTSDNNLRDCLDLAEDDNTMLSQDDLIQDYKKMGKRKKMAPVKAKGSLDQNEERAATQNGLKRISSNEKLASFDKEWKVIASEVMGDQKCFCLAMLEDRMTVLSLAFRPYPATPPSSNKGDPDTPQSHSPRGSLAQLMEKQCSLTPLAPMHNTRSALGTAVLNGKLAALGGYNRCAVHNTMEVFDNKLNVWQEVAPMNEARGRFDSCMVAGKLYAVGGSDGTRELRTVECYDPQTDKWTNIKDMDYKRSHAGVTGLQGCLYVIGGLSGTRAVRECEKYDPVEDKWTSIAKLNTSRSQAGVTVYQGRIVAIGGCCAWDTINSVETYDPEDDKWTYLPAMNTSRRGMGAASFKGKLFALGGSDGSFSLATVEVYSPITGTWTFCPSLSVPRANVSAAVIRHRLYAVGGFSGKAFLDSIEYLVGNGADESKQDWCSFLPMKNAGDGPDHIAEESEEESKPRENGDHRDSSGSENEVNGVNGGASSS